MACGREPQRGNPDTRTYRWVDHRASSRLYSFLLPRREQKAKDAAMPMLSNVSAVGSGTGELFAEVMVTDQLSIQLVVTCVLPVATPLLVS